MASKMEITNRFAALDPLIEEDELVPPFMNMDLEGLTAPEEAENPEESRIPDQFTFGGWMRHPKLNVRKTCPSCRIRFANDAEANPNCDCLEHTYTDIWEKVEKEISQDLEWHLFKCIRGYCWERAHEVLGHSVAVLRNVEDLTPQERAERLATAYKRTAWDFISQVKGTVKCYPEPLDDMDFDENYLGVTYDDDSENGEEHDDEYADEYDDEYDECASINDHDIDSLRQQRQQKFKKQGSRKQQQQHQRQQEQQRRLQRHQREARKEQRQAN